MKINFNPSKRHFKQIELWLTMEHSITNNGFLCNIKSIENSFIQGKAIVVEDNYETIGFMTYLIKEGVVFNIDILAINFNKRGQGIGRIFVNSVLDRMKNQGLLVSELICAPVSSELFWKRLNFQDFPKFSNDDGVRLYKPLTSVLNPNSDEAGTITIQLWDKEPYQINKYPPKWTWKINHIHQELPIIIPAHYDWNISWEDKFKMSFYNGKVKRFNLKHIQFGDFLIIKD